MRNLRTRTGHASPAQPHNTATARLALCS